MTKKESVICVRFSDTTIQICYYNDCSTEFVTTDKPINIIFTEQSIEFFQKTNEARVFNLMKSEEELQTLLNRQQNHCNFEMPTPQECWILAMKDLFMKTISHSKLKYITVEAILLALPTTLHPSLRKMISIAVDSFKEIYQKECQKEMTIKIIPNSMLATAYLQRVPTHFETLTHLSKNKLYFYCFFEYGFRTTEWNVVLSKDSDSILLETGTYHEGFMECADVCRKLVCELPINTKTLDYDEWRSRDKSDYTNTWRSRLNNLSSNNKIELTDAYSQSVCVDNKEFGGYLKDHNETIYNEMMKSIVQAETLINKMDDILMGNTIINLKEYRKKYGNLKVEHCHIEFPQKNWSLVNYIQHHPIRSFQIVDDGVINDKLSYIGGIYARMFSDEIIGEQSHNKGEEERHLYCSVTEMIHPKRFRIYKRIYTEEKQTYEDPSTNEKCEEIITKPSNQYLFDFPENHTSSSLPIQIGKLEGDEKDVVEYYIHDNTFNKSVGIISLFQTNEYSLLLSNYLGNYLPTYESHSQSKNPIIKQKENILYEKKVSTLSYQNDFTMKHQSSFAINTLSYVSIMKEETVMNLYTSESVSYYETIFENNHQKSSIIYNLKKKYDEQLKKEYKSIVQSHIKLLIEQYKNDPNVFENKMKEYFEENKEYFTINN